MSLLGSRQARLRVGILTVAAAIFLPCVAGIILAYHQQDLGPTGATLLLILLFAASFSMGLIASRRREPAMGLHVDALVEQMNRMERLDFTMGPPLVSPHADVSRLAQSVEAMRAAIGPVARFMPRRPVQALLAAGRTLEPGGETREATILFAGLADTGALALKVLPHELMLRVSDYLQAVAAEISEHHGVVDKYVGDTVMALWNAPADTPDHAALACRAALIAQGRLARFDKDEMGQERPASARQPNARQPIALRVGLHTDRVTAGVIGTSEHLSYTALGAGVTIAARLEALNKSYGTAICVSQTVRDQVMDRFLMRPLDVVAVKGRDEPVGIYELLGFLPDEYAPDDFPAMAHDFVVPSLRASPAQVLKARLTEQAFARWRAGDMVAAGRAYRKLAQTFPGDRVAELYIKRCAISPSTIRPGVEAAEAGSNAPEILLQGS